MCGPRRSPTSSGQFSAGQRSQIVQTVRAALKSDPSILRDAIVAVQADNERLEAQARKAAMTSHGDQLVAASLARRSATRMVP